MTELFKVPAVVPTVLGFELLVLMIYMVYQMYIEMIFVLGIEMVRCSYPAVKDPSYSSSGSWLISLIAVNPVFDLIT